jgi:hypothetical protein
MFGNCSLRLVLGRELGGLTNALSVPVGEFAFDEAPQANQLQFLVELLRIFLDDFRRNRAYQRG